MKKTIYSMLCAGLALFLGGMIPAAAAAGPTWGGAVRLRHEYWKNVFDVSDALADNRNYFRAKLSLWGQMPVAGPLSAYARLATESKPYIEYYSNNVARSTVYDINETVIDNLYVDVKTPGGLPLDLRLGRQDFLGVYGEGFLLMDGTPMDGSRTFYFNAAQAVWRMCEKSSLHALYINSRKFDDILPVINEVPGKQLLNATNETAAGLYHFFDGVARLHGEVYYLWKQEDGGGPLLTLRETRLHTIGAFGRYSVTDRLTVRAQAAGQTGTWGAENRSGLGGYAFVDASFKERPLAPFFTAGFVYLSGDDPSTAACEAWDPLFSRWPWLSELLILSFNSESGMAYWTNLGMARAGVAITPLNKLKLSAWANLLTAPQKGSGAGIYGTGTSRGTLMQGRVDYTFNARITAYFLAEYFKPGDFYATGSNDAMFLRTEAQYKF